LDDFKLTEAMVGHGHLYESAWVSHRGPKKQPAFTPKGIDGVCALRCNVAQMFRGNEPILTAIVV
jgi:hypothetical protein